MDSLTRSPLARTVLVLLSSTAFSSTLPAQVIPGPLAVQVRSAGDAKPVPGVLVHVGGRMAVSDPAGKVVFDGMPAGTYDLWCRQPGHQEFRETIELQNGERAEQVVSLVPEVLSPLRLRFIEETSEEPVGGARIRLVPRGVAPALQGPMVFSADSAGNVATIAVPEGVYHLTVETPGYAMLSQDIEHKATAQPMEFKLQAVSRNVSCTVVVTDDQDRPISGADVELWEVYPLARIAAGKTAGTGTVVFSDLRVGTVNPTVKDKTLAATCRNEAVVRVQAQGHAMTLQSIRLTETNPARVTTAAMKIIPERQPNESKADAQSLLAGQTVSLRIDRNDDQDWFAFDLREASRVHLSFNNVPLALFATAFDSAGKSVATLGKYGGQPATSDWDLPAGRYWVQVTAWGMNAASAAEIIMAFTTETAADPLESNNTTPEAKPIQIGQHMRGIIFPVGDADHFALRLDRAGTLRVESANAPRIERTVTVVDDKGKEYPVLNCYSGVGGAGDWPLPSGDYRVVVTKWGNNGCSLDPYDFRVLFMADDGVDDPFQRPGGRLSAVRELSLHGHNYGTVNPTGDRDLYTLSIPSKGTLRVLQQGSIELTTRVLDSRGEMLRTVNSYAGSSNLASHPFSAATTAYLEVTKWGNNGWSPFPYVLRTWFDPAGEFERLQDNDNPKTATPIDLGTMVRDNICPTGDQDWYQLVIDQPGILNVWFEARPQLTVRLHDAAGKTLEAVNAYLNTQNQVNWDVVPGVYGLQVAAWGNNVESAWDYALKPTLHRAVPGETADPTKSPAIPLKIGEARPCGIELIGDVERFRVSIPSKGEYVYFIGGPIETSTTATNSRTAAPFFQRLAYASTTTRHDFVADGPMELDLVVTAWGNNKRNAQPNWVMVGPKAASLRSPAVSWTVNAFEPTKVTFALAAVPGVPSLPAVSLDLNGDGRPDATVTSGQSQTLEFPTQGLYRAASWGTDNSIWARGEFWVQATGQPVREGMRVLIATPSEGEWIDRMAPVHVTAISYEGKPIRQVDLQINGRYVGSDYTLPYEFEVPWQTAAGGACTLVATATDAAGRREAYTRKLQVSDYFNLLPTDGSVVTGNEVTISWEGGTFGPARVRYRPRQDDKTETDWKEVVGQNARARRVQIADLEAEKVYEVQPLGGSEPGPVREVTRVKGLAFTQSRYGGTIQRDYDQKIPVAVRNHATEKRVVRLRCDQPRDGNLLVAFIGEGEKNRPVELGPDEQRAFTLGFSAQDVVQERHELPIYIESEDGYSDQAQVEVLVKLPKVDLQWVDRTPQGQEGLSRTYELVNRGDTLTDVNVGAANDSVRISPEVKHGLIQAGQRLRFDVYPKIGEGFTGCEDEIQATSIGKTASSRYEGKLKPGEQVFHLDMTAGLDPVTRESENVETAVRAARRLVGQYLSPATVDWTARTDPQDTNHDGKPDRWTVTDVLNQTRWFGQDTDGDGEVDFAQADVGLDGEIDHSSVLDQGRWQATNLLDAWLEMNFTIPQHRSAYEPHDLDVVVNGNVVGQLKQTIPEGNYRFPLAPAALNWGGADNALEINSHFRNFAHYAISSDFQLKTRLLAAKAYAIGASRQDAVRRLLDSDKGFSTDGPDYSVSSEDLDLTPKDKLTPGMPIRIAGTVRNLGAAAGDRLEIALFLAVPGTQGKELIRQSMAAPGLMTDSPFEFIWPAAPGNHSLRVMVDPDNLIGESNRKNNTAILGVVVPGDEVPPTLTVVQPERDLTTSNGSVNLLATATDEAGIIAVTVSIDDGMVRPLYRTSNGFEGIARLQPGTHSLRFRVTDSGGLHVEDTRVVKVEAARPACRIVSPTEGATVDVAETRVLVSASEAAQSCVRINRGPWLALKPAGDLWAGRVDLPFGRCQIDVVVIDASGVRQTQSVTVHCTAQPEQETQRDREKSLARHDGQESPEVGSARYARSAPDREREMEIPADPDARMFSRVPTGRGPWQSPFTPEGIEPTVVAMSDSQPNRLPASSSDASDRAGPADLPEENDVVPPPGVAATTTRPSAPSAAPPSPGDRRQAPTGFVVDRQRNDWYCPNRPKIGINFKLPDWLTKEEFQEILKKGPNSAEFRALEGRLLAEYWRRNFGRTIKGQTIDELLLKYKELLLRRCDRLEPVDGKMPSFLQSLGLAADDPPTDPRQLEAWREKMKELTEVYWLRLLATQDAATVIEGMRMRAEALSKYDQASQLQAEAIIIEIQANQKITQDVLEALPYTGEALDLIAAVTGESLSGEQLSGWERFFRTACAAGPAALEEALKRSPRAQEAVAQFLAAAGEMGGDMKNALLRRIGADIDKFDQFTDDAIRFLTKERHIFGRNADDVVDAARTGYRQTAAGMEDLRQLERAKDASRQTLNDLDDLVRKGRQAGDADMEEVILRLQRDKTAQSLMNSSEVSDEVRKKANETIKRIYRDTDAPTMARIQNSPEVQKFARDRGLDPDNLEVSVWSPTNTRGASTVDPDFKKFGRDRDVTYQITGRTKDGRTVTLDVNHDISGPIYKEELYRRCHGGNLPTGDAAQRARAINQFADDTDQMVTSRWHREAYNTGPDVQISDWLNNDITPPVARVEDIRDTMMIKSQHWFEQAAEAGRDTVKYSRDTAEGMRQATKQWDNIVARRAALYGANVPPQLDRAIDIFKQVDRGVISPKQAEHMLEQLGNLTGGARLTPQRVVENMAHYFEAIEKGPGKAFRSIKTAELARTLDGVSDLTRRTDLINDAYRGGQISGETFRQMREGSFRLPPNSTPQQRQQLKNWALGAWDRRAISLTERKLIEGQVGSLEE